MNNEKETRIEPKSEIPVIPVLEPIHLALEPLHAATSNVSRPGNSRTGTRASSRSRPVVLSISRGSSRSRCYGGQDGYSVFTPEDDLDSDATRDEEAQARIRKAEDEEEEAKSDDSRVHEGVGFVVGFDEADPLDPRRIGKLRKWVIVLIVSASSLCV
jgi:hypothetical protein